MPFSFGPRGAFLQISQPINRITERPMRNYSTIFQIILLIALAMGLLVAFANLLPVGADYYYTFRPITTEWLRGEIDLYTQPLFYDFFNPPWTLILIAPTTLLPMQYGQAVLTCVTLFSMLLAIRLCRIPWEESHRLFLPTVLAIVNPLTLDLITRGNVDGFVLLGVSLAWWGVKNRSPLLLGTGFWLISIKPINAIMPACLILWAIRDWSPRQKATVALPLAVTLVASFFVFGIDWPLRWLNYICQKPPYPGSVINLGRIFSLLHVPPAIALWVAAVAFMAFLIWLVTRRIKVSEIDLNLAITLNIIVSPYVATYHYVMLAPAYVSVASRRRILLALWLVPLSQLLGIWFDHDVFLINMLYPLALLLAIVWLSRRQPQPLSANRR